jgi:hypothetical protein
VVKLDVSTGELVMVRKFSMVCGFALLASVNSAFALGPVVRSDAAQTDVHDVSFFGRPYPYGYTGWGPCVRYVEVQTRHGVRLRRVRICR